MNTATNQYSVDQFLFGFEYETLVGINDVVNCKSNTKPARVSNAYANDSDKQFSHVTRSLLASAINIPEKFKDGVKALCEFNAVSKDEVVDKSVVSSSWLITSDFSVGIGSSDIYSSFTKLLQPETNTEKEPSVPSTIVEYIEFVSPVITSEYVNTYLSNVLNDHFCCNGKFSYWNNATTSNHIHVSLKDAFRNPEILFKVVMAWWYFEPVFMLMVSGKRRSNGYCDLMRNLIDTEINNLDTFKYLVYEYLKHTDKPNDNNIILKHIIKLFQGGVKQVNRYAAFNMLNLLPGSIGTIEFRLKHGSSSGKENVHYINFLMYFILSVVNWEHCITELLDDNQKEYMWNLYEKGNLLGVKPDNDVIKVDKKYFTEDEEGKVIPFECLVTFIKNGLREDENNEFDKCAEYYRDNVIKYTVINADQMKGGKKIKKQLELETVEQLRKRCAKMKLKGYSKLCKSDLIKLLRK